MKRIFGPKGEEVMQGWRKLHNEEFHNSHSSPNIITVIKSSRMRRMEHTVCVEEVRKAY
jgi:hypothetical protein